MDLGEFDGTIAFYARVKSLATPSARLLDLGAGRGEWVEDSVAVRRGMRWFRGEIAEVVGADVDPAVLQNPSLDRVVRMESLGTADATGFDIVVSDYVLEHVEDPEEFVQRVSACLKPGGWFCARTPNRWGYIGVGNRIVPNSHHVRLLRRLQPDRQPQDVFPTRYRMNDASALRRAFPSSSWDLYIIYQNPDPAYFGNSRMAYRAMSQVQRRLLPKKMSSVLHVFVQRKPDR